MGIVDTTVLIHSLRRYSPALTWLGGLTERLAITSITWLEIMDGAGSKDGQARAKLLY